MKDTLFLETDKDLSNVGRVEITGKDNLGLELYTDDSYWHTEEPTEEGWYIIFHKNQFMFDTLFHFHDGAFWHWNDSKECNTKLDVSLVLAWHKIPPYEG